MADDDHRLGTTDLDSDDRQLLRRTDQSGDKSASRGLERAGLLAVRRTREYLCGAVDLDRSGVAVREDAATRWRVAQFGADADRGDGRGRAPRVAAAHAHAPEPA